ncbi:hypothetical protein HZ326_1092 [Fusarium oxysporum f. sp. albedinis]|nr:hypothetical protein HZ326_1092 [Fusarium oxysporum f. sp. albedinis]
MDHQLIFRGVALSRRDRLACIADCRRIGGKRHMTFQTPTSPHSSPQKGRFFFLGNSIVINTKHVDSSSLITFVAQSLSKLSPDLLVHVNRSPETKTTKLPIRSFLTYV